jgi:NAD(P)-dependent dehydrogenase (short-subunit alcohol dehydrogenase family)
MAAATRVIVTQGLSAPTATIAKEAGVSNGSLFTYFETKADMFNQLYLELMNSMAEATMDFMVQDPANADKHCKAGFEALWRVLAWFSQPLNDLSLIKDGGRIVNVSTARTRLISPGGAAYGSIKGAVEVLTKYMAKELGPRRIAVNAVAPGATETDFSGGIVRDNPAVNKRVAEGTALGRAGVPDDIGRMIASLLSEDNRWINAERIEVSGGYV